jgi:hypothetical protein
MLGFNTSGNSSNILCRNADDRYDATRGKDKLSVRDLPQRIFNLGHNFVL